MVGSGAGVWLPGLAADEGVGAVKCPGCGHPTMAFGGVSVEPPPLCVCAKGQAPEEPEAPIILPLE